MDFKRKRYDPTEKFGAIVQADSGNIVGRYETRGRDLVERERRIVTDFLLGISKQRETPMSKQNGEATNLCFIAGIIRTHKITADRAFLLVDVGEASKFLPVVVWDDAQLLEIVGRYKVEDFIQVRGWAQGWSQKKDGKWENHVHIRITEVRNPKPRPQRSTVSQRLAEHLKDDEVPF